MTTTTTYGSALTAGLNKITKENRVRHVEADEVEALVEDGWSLVSVVEAYPEPGPGEEHTVTRSPKRESQNRKIDTGLVRVVDGNREVWLEPSEAHSERARLEAIQAEAFSELQRDERATERLKAATQTLAALDQQEADFSEEAQAVEQAACERYAAQQQRYVEVILDFIEVGSAYAAAAETLNRTPRAGGVRPARLSVRAVADRDLGAALQEVRQFTGMGC
jgi:hypothetical protein